MKPRLLTALALMAVPSWCAADAAMPPDPLMQNLVPVPFSTLDLAVRNKTQAPGVNLWRLAGELEAMTTAQVKTVTFGAWRAYRRFRTDALYAASAGLSLWVEHDLADAVATMMFNGSWEDMDDSIGDYDIDLEGEAGHQWAKLASRDWKKAIALLRKLSGWESTGQFASSAAQAAKLTPEQAAEFVAIIAPKPMEGNSLQGIVRDLMINLATSRGLPATKAWAKALRPAKARGIALNFLTKLEELPPKQPEEPQTFSDDALGKLRALSSLGDFWRFPFPLYRAVMKLGPAEALTLGKQHTAHPLSKEVPWLRWMLFMRASEGDPVAAGRLACGLQFGEAASLTEAFAVRKDGAAALEDIRRMMEKADREVPLNGRLTHGDNTKLTRWLNEITTLLRRVKGRHDREAAFGGLLTHADIGDPAKWLAEVANLKLDYQCAAPLFARLGAAGRAREALELAGTLEPSNARETLITAACDTWILTDVRGYFRFFNEAEQSADPAREALAVTMSSSFDQLANFGAREVLLDENAIPPKYLYWSSHSWTLFPFEDCDFTLRFLERHADDPAYTSPLFHFTDVAVRFEPERAAALQRRAQAAQLAKLLRENGQANDVEIQWRRDVTLQLPRLVQFWPEKAVAITAPASVKEWESLCWEMLAHHSQRFPIMLRKAPPAVRESLAKMLTEVDGTGREPLLSAEQRRRIAEALHAMK